MSRPTFLMKRLTRMSDKLQVLTTGDRKTVRENDQRRRRFSQTSEIFVPVTSSFTSITAWLGSAVYRRLILDQEPASSCFCSTPTKQSYTFRSNAWTWSSVTQVQKVINRNSI